MDKKNPTLGNLIASDTDYLSYISSLSNHYGTTVDYIMVNSESKNMTDGTGNYR